MIEINKTYYASFGGGIFHLVKVIGKTDTSGFPKYLLYKDHVYYDCAIVCNDMEWSKTPSAILDTELFENLSECIAHMFSEKDKYLQQYVNSEKVKFNKTFKEYFDRLEHIKKHSDLAV